MEGFHAADLAPSSLDARVKWFRAAIPTGRRPRLGALVQHVELTDDRRGATERYLGLLAKVLPPDALPTLDDALASPHLLIGTEDEIIAQLRTQHTRWELTRYTVRADVADTIGAVIERLAASDTTTN